MKELILLLSQVKAGKCQKLGIAKGKYYLPKDWRDMHRINKQLLGDGRYS